MYGMTEARPLRNGEDASDLVAALVAKVGAFHKEVSRLHGDVGRLHGRVKVMHRDLDRLHRKIEGTRARIRVLRSKNRVQRRGGAGLYRPAGRTLLSNRFDAFFQAGMILYGRGHG
jgi:hypothetical protein